MKLTIRGDLADLDLEIVIDAGSVGGGAAASAKEPQHARVDAGAGERAADASVEEIPGVAGVHEQPEMGAASGAHRGLAVGGVCRGVDDRLGLRADDACGQPEHQPALTTIQGLDAALADIRSRVEAHVDNPPQPVERPAELDLSRPHTDDLAFPDFLDRRKGRAE